MLPDASENEVIETYVKAIWGTTNTVSSAVIYQADAPVVTFTCTGTTLDFSCNANGQAELSFDELENDKRARNLAWLVSKTFCISC